MAEGDEFATLGELIARFLAKFALRDLLSGFLGRAIDLTGWHFPNCCPNRNALLVNKNDFAVARHWRNDHSCFPVHYRPCPGQRTRWRSHMVGHNFEMRIREMRLARNGFPALLHNASSVVAAVLSGKLVGRSRCGANLPATSAEQFAPAFDLCRDIPR